MQPGGRSIRCLSILVLSVLLSPPVAAAAESRLPYTAADRARLEIARDYGGLVLDIGRDRWSGKDTPLFVDGVRVRDHEPVVWKRHNKEYIISNLASQQNLFRAFVGLSNLTGDDRYRKAAAAAIKYHFDNLTDGAGLLKWGGHEFIDLNTLEPAGIVGELHELKLNYPFYELMWAVDSKATARFIRAFWNAHIRNWSILDMSRHGGYNQNIGLLWEHPYDDPDPFFEERGLTFINTGSDLIYAAGAIYALGGEEHAWRWGRRMAEMYVKARHPRTGLGAYQYSKPVRRDEPPEEGPLEGEYTWSRYGDRAENQFGRQFGDTAREGWALWGERVRRIYVGNAFMQLGLAEAMGEKGGELLEWTVDGLVAFARHAYHPRENFFRPMWADGTDLTGRQFPRTGYYGREGRQWRPLAADMEFLMTYARAYRLSGDRLLWLVARSIASGLGIGDIGLRPGRSVAMSPDAPGSSPEEIFALLELYRAVPHPQYVLRARVVADRMIEERYHNGVFARSKSHLNANFDGLEFPAILALEAALRGEPELVPEHVGGRGYIHGPFGDGEGRTEDENAIWSVRRGVN